MLLGIDHIVIVVRDLDAAAQDYERLGFTVVPGGKHPVGTHNALIAFADSTVCVSRNIDSMIGALEPSQPATIRVGASRERTPPPAPSPLAERGL